MEWCRYLLFMWQFAVLWNGPVLTEHLASPFTRQLCPNRLDSLPKADQCTVQYFNSEYIAELCNTINPVIYAGKILMLIHHFEPNFIFMRNLVANQ